MHMAFLSRGFKNLQWYGMTSEHHPCFELFYRNTGGFLYGKPCVTRLSTFLAYVPIYHETPNFTKGENRP